MSSCVVAVGIAGVTVGVNHINVIEWRRRNPGLREDDNWLSGMTVLIEVVVGLNTLTNDMKLPHRRQAVNGVHMVDGLVQHGQKLLVDRDRRRQGQSRFEEPAFRRMQSMEHKL